MNYDQSTSSDLYTQLKTALDAMKTTPPWLSGPRSEVSGRDSLQRALHTCELGCNVQGAWTASTTTDC